jgi:hypothetical protein
MRLPYILTRAVTQGKWCGTQTDAPDWTACDAYGRMRTPEQGFTAKLTIEQREAVGLAMADTNMSARQISKAAKLGQLADFKTGELLEPFEVSPSYTADLGSALRRRRQGKTSQRRRHGAQGRGRGTTPQVP